MSRIGKQPLPVPDKVKVDISGQTVFIEGPKGKLAKTFNRAAKISLGDREINVAPTDSTRFANAMYGTARSIIAGMVQGVTEGFVKNLEINGVGFNAVLKGSTLDLALGYSHPIIYPVPNGIIGNGKIINEAGGPPSQHRIRVAVGVAYGSDVDQVIEVLLGVAIDHAEVLSNPEPRVRFRTFGDFALNFELLSWIANPADRGRVSHELNCAVYKALRSNKIEIPFPQRDIHVRTMPASID